MSIAPRLVPLLVEGLHFTVRLPGSKSETIRALTAAALAPGRSHLYGALRADDPEAMAAALRSLGASIEDDAEPWAVDGTAGRLHESTEPIDANESGLSARIIMALAASVGGATTISGRGRLPERPMGGLAAALRSQGVEVDRERIPIRVVGRGRLWGGRIEVDCSESSQYATALMLVAPTMRSPCVLEVKGSTGSEGYLEVTAATMRRFGVELERTITGYEIDNAGYRSADVVIEPDASAAVYPMAIAAITGGRVLIADLDERSPQPDLKVARVLETMGCRTGWGEGGLTLDARDTELVGVDVDMADAPDGALALAVVCLFARTPSRISGLGSLRHKESDRLAALSQEMTRLGGEVEVTGDALSVSPSTLNGGVVDPHGDHRIAMAMAVAGTRIPGVSVSTPGVVEKTWPGFWAFLDELVDEVVR